MEGGGAERVVSTILNNFSNDYKCYLILIENNMDYILNNNIEVISLNVNSNSSGIKKLIMLPILAYKLSKIIKKYKFNKVVSFLYRANYINILSKFFSKHKVIISERIAASSMYYDKSLTSQVNKFLIKNLYNKSDLIISVSKAIKADLKYNFYIKTKQIVVYNPYDINQINKLAQEDIDIEIDEEKSIITVGSLGVRKNHKMLIRAFSLIENKNIILYILGKGEEEDILKQLTKELNLENRVLFLGFDNNPYKYLSKCDIFILSSNSEGFPNVLAEAMVCGCSVISTDCLSGPREILAPKSSIDFQLRNNIELAEYGILSPIKEVEKLKEAMNIMISNKIQRNLYKEKAILRVDDFKIDKIIKQYEDVICAE